MSLAMVLKITLESLHDLIHRSARPDRFDYTDVLFIPIVNLDAYEYINSRYGKSDWEDAKMKRKNFNLVQACE